MTPRDEARETLHLYQMRTGVSLGEIALRMGMARRSLIQFASFGQYGDGPGTETAGRIKAWIDAHPPESPELPGKLYMTENVRMIDRQIYNVKRGHWALVYGPPATQKSFVFEYRMAEAWQKSLEPGVVYVYADPDMTPLALLRDIALGLGGTVGRDRNNALRYILAALKRRKSPVALIVDEAQHLGKRLDTLETLRQVADRGRIGLLVAGHDNIEDIFQPRPDCQLEQWRSRIEQHRSCLPGLSENEAREILRGELGDMLESVIKKAVEGSMTEDLRKRKKYISARRLFNAIRDFKDRRAPRQVN